MIVSSVNFNVLSPQKIRDISVCEVVTDELYEDNKPKYGGLRDPRFGASSRRSTCPTCQLNWSECSGHFGYYTLPHPVYHIGWMSEVLQWLRRTCQKCGKVSLNIRTKKCSVCQHVPAKYTKINSTTIRMTSPSGQKNIMAHEAYEHLSKIKQEDVSIFHTKNNHFHPSWLILTLLPIPPNCVRPSPTMDGDEVRGEDDITRRLLYVLRISKTYNNVTNETTHVKEHTMNRVQDAVHMYIDQTRMSSKQHNSQKSISERLRGKQGRLRGTLMGKRCNFTARTVITGDAMLDMREVGVPQQVAETLTIVEHVNRLNYHDLREQVANQDKRIKYIIKKDGSRLDMRTVRGQADLTVGCAVERILKDGDPVLFNRQPSLHRMSIMCHRAKILKQGKTFRLNLSCTTPYNADFDGDEMNLHALQTHESRADALELMSVAKNIITPQSNKPVMGIVQDSLLSAFMMTSPGVTLDKAEMCNIIMWVEGGELPEPAFKQPKEAWTGLQCMSLLFPKDFYWRDQIKNGQLLSGPLGKKALGRSHGSIIHRLYNDYGPDRTCQFINELQRINHLWFSTQGFSIGIGDMRITEETAQNVRNECANVDNDAQKIRTEKGTDAEMHINRMLNQTRDSMGLIAQNAMKDDNCLGLMVKSGSKGSMVNILQIMACVGQQNCSGKRMQPTLGGRTLPMFKSDDNSTRARGFVQHSYIDGLTPDEYWHHTVGGREGLIDTAVKTSTTGYIQRRLVKSLESVHVANDTTVRDSQKRVIQFKYGEDGIDGMCHEMVTCPFDDIDQLDGHYDLQKWPENKEAFEMWKWNAEYKLGDKWAMAIPVERIFKLKRDQGHTNKTREIITPLLKAVENLPLAHAYTLAILTHNQNNTSEKSLREIVSILLQKWHKSIVAPGEMVGTIAAQSVGEPTTQMTLNTFHNAGNSAKNVTLGVPRFEELINASSKMKTPSLTVFTKDCKLIPEKAWKLTTELKRTTLRDIIETQTYNTDVNLDGLEKYLELPDDNKWSKKTKPKNILKCVLNRTKMVQNGITLLEIVEKLREQSFSRHLAFGYTMVIEGNDELYVRTKHNKNFFQYVKNILDTTVKGSQYIPSVNIRVERQQFVIDTEGIDLNHIKLIEAIAQNKVQCNDIFQVLKIYGVEAARRVILQEMQNVLGAYGIYVNMRHLMTIVDWMTWGGKICALTRHGVKKMMASTTPLKRATFEQPVEIFHHAATKGLHDELSGISEQLLIGKEPKCGSYFNGVVTDTEYQKQWDEDDWEPMEIEEEDLFADSWRPEPAPVDAMDVDDSWGAHTTYAIPQQPAWQQQQDPWQQQQAVPQQPAWQQQQAVPQQPAWQQQQAVPQQPAWQQQQSVPQKPAWQQQQSVQLNAAYSPASPAYSPASPAYSPASPAYSPASPAYSPASPAYSPASPAYSPASPAYSPASPAYSPASPTYSPASPTYSPASPMYSPASPTYSPSNTTEESPTKRQRRL
jgi:DNA-directed RNA polymerase II subunit RPB1